MENKKGNEIFLGVIGVATLVVAIIGATFAYFSATANSTPNAIAATSTSVSLGFENDTTRLKTNLIPAYDNIAIAGMNKEGATKEECVDDNKNNVCGVYTFTVGNPSTTTSQQVYARIEIFDDNNDSNDFENLYFRIYEVDSEGQETQVVGPTNFASAAVVNDSEGQAMYNGKEVIRLTALDNLLSPSPESGTTAEGYDAEKPSTYGASADGNNVKNYKMLVWLRETEDIQNTSDGNKVFAAGIVFTTEGGGNSGVTGMIGTTVGANETTTPAE